MAWKRRLYLCLSLIRLYFALAPSYIHPDEHFQGPEVVAGEHFGWKVTKTWEFTADHPIRSYVPLLAVYALPMTVLQWIVNAAPNPTMLFYSVRLLFYFFSMVYEDWALLELGSTIAPNGGLLLTASSWVTWSIQTRSFSNSVETVVLLWSLVFMQRIVSSKGPAIRNCVTLALFVVFGTFNRITFPAFLFLPGISLLRHFIRYPSSVLAFAVPAIFFTAAFAVLDTHIYTQIPMDSLKLTDLIFTPLNNLIYNSSTANLAQHGLHPRYTHVLINLPQLLGPSLILLLFSIHPRLLTGCTPLQAAVSGIVTLSAFQHQEARFLIPAVPLILASVRLPASTAWRRRWMVAWALFNVAFGVLMGVFHQGGVVPAQLYLGSVEGLEQAVWWKTYKPPTWLLGARSRQVRTVDLMGAKVDVLANVAREMAVCDDDNRRQKTKKRRLRRVIVAPSSAVALDRWIEGAGGSEDDSFVLRKVWSYSRHLNLDDMDFGDDGVVPTLERVVGRRGITVYEVVKVGCKHRTRGETSTAGDVDDTQGNGGERDL
ncbi:GPI mannosyltransferase [Drechslerella dactyloides]|uniref:Mannosyltransferase n=1 Tax=Drechslerella dactyloides TaxID=74499 RepID=A0AAD6J4L5_DREDA|nr:GPI mannosyltransferase [Drechslerella dactyloides]